MGELGIRSGVAAMMFLAAAGLAAAPQPAPSRWAKTPDARDYLRVRPATAGPGSRAAVRCHVDAAGLLSACSAVTETPAGSGYAQALASLAPLFQMKPELVAKEAPDGQVIIVDSSEHYDKAPEWLHKPSVEDLLVVWPKAAWAKNQGGRATINCMVSLQGALYDCIPISESPAGANFGSAAVALTPQFLMKPASLRGEPVSTTVNIPVKFEIPGGRRFSGGIEEPGHTAAPATLAWADAPSYADVAAAYPKKAAEARLGGHATVSCRFTSKGALTDCEAISEEPRGQGFGAAARALAHHFRAPATLSPKTLKDAAVQVPFTFDPSVLGDEKPAIGKPQWAVLPSPEETAAAFDAVTKAGVVGTVRVTMSCTVEPGGEVAGCAVTRENPAGRGVGQAALGLTPHFRMTTWTAEGLPTVGGRVNIPLRYEGGAKPPQPPAAASVP